MLLSPAGWLGHASCPAWFQISSLNSSSINLKKNTSEQIALTLFSGDMTYTDSWGDSIRQSLSHPEQCLAPLQSAISPGNCCGPGHLEGMQPGQEMSISPSSSVYVYTTVAFQHAGYWVLLLASGKKETGSPETSPPSSHM